MNTQEQINSQVHSQFKFRSLRRTLEILDCSKPFLYGLTRRNLIKAHYFEYDDKGKPKGKPYFNIDEIQEVLS